MAHVGGSIRKARKKSPTRDKKLEEALAQTAQKVGGGIKFHDTKHKYLFNKLSGRGAAHDSPECRDMMHGIMQHYHPSFWSSYQAGRVKDFPRFENDHAHSYDRKPPMKKGSQADVINSGGNLSALSFSENGFLMSHNSEFHHYLEIV